MARARKQKKPAPPPARRWSVVLACAVVVLVEVAVLPGAASPFRLVKEAVALGGLLLVAGTAVAISLRRGTMVFPRGPVSAALIALPLLQAASAAWSRHPQRAIESAVGTGIWILAALWLSTLDRRERGRIAIWAATGAAVSAAFLMLQAAGLHPLALHAADDGDRGLLFGLTGNPADLAAAAALLIPLLVFAPGDVVGRRRRWILVGLLAAGVVVSQTFTGYASLLITTLVVLFRRRSRTLWAIAGVVGITLVAIALASGLGVRIDKQVRRIQSGDWYFLLSARADGWSAASEMVRARPLAGVGAGNFTVEYYPARLAWLSAHGESGGRGELATHFEWAHSDPLQLAAELGAAGLLWLAALLAALAYSEARRDPAVVTTALALLPFALLHYPLHLAVGILPVVLALGAALARETLTDVTVERGPAATAGAIILMLATAVGVVWQVQRVALDVWRGAVEHTIGMLDRVEDDRRRAAAAAAFETQIGDRIRRAPGHAPWLWRVLGQVRLTVGDARGAEEAFRTSNRLWPHEDAEFWLGLSLAAQNRRGEAVVVLGRVCRTNPALIQQIPDQGLRRAVRDLVRARRDSGP